MIARFNGKDFKIEQEVSFRKSSRETRFDDIRIDFTGFTLDDRPIKWQEVQLVEEDVVKYYGYVENISVDRFDTPFQRTFLDIGLMSPRSFLSVRTTSASGVSVPLNTAVENILQPLINEGFTIEQNELPNVEINYVFTFKKIEKILNELGKDNNFYWFVDEQKKIYLKSLSFLEQQEANTFDEFKFSLKPSISAVDYCNVVNLKNQLIFREKEMLAGRTIVPGETYNLPFPISISERTGRRLAVQDQVSSAGHNLFRFSFVISGDTVIYQIFYDTVAQEIVVLGDIGIDGEDDKNLLLVTDAFNKTLITGFKTRDDFVTITLNDIKTESALARTSTVYTDINEVNKQKDKSSPSGRVEKTIDLKDQFLTARDSLELAKTELLNQSSATDEIEVFFRIPIADATQLTDKFLPLTKVSANFPEYLTEGEFIITDTDYIQTNEIVEFSFVAKNVNLVENFIDLYREREEDNEEEIFDNIYSILIDDEDIEEKKVTFVNGVIVDDN